MMNLFDSENPVFINFSGLIDELGRVELLPNFHSNERPNVNTPDHETPYRVALHYKGDGLLERPIYPTRVNGCGPEEGKGLDYLAFCVSLPHVDGADLIQLLQDDRVIFQRSLGAPPSIDSLSVKVLDEKIEVTWQTNAIENTMALVTVTLSNGRAIPVGRAYNKSDISFSLSGLPSGDNVCIEVSITDGLSTATMKSDSVSVKPTAPLATIISPADGSCFQSFDPISLVANCHDAVGDQLSWKDLRVAWSVDGEIYRYDSPHTMAADLGSGTHQVEVTCELWGVLAKSTIHISEPCEQLKKHDELFKRITYVEVDPDTQTGR